METNQVKKCNNCGRELPLSEFYLNGKGRRSICKTCSKEKINKKYYERKEIIDDYKSQLGCAKCGDTRPYCLDFHHRDPTQKNTKINRLSSSNKSIDKIMEEIKKCEVLCANCHREFHYLNFLDGITLEEYLALEN